MFFWTHEITVVVAFTVHCCAWKFSIFW
jgi:hypothetical protein